MISFSLKLVIRDIGAMFSGVHSKRALDCSELFRARFTTLKNQLISGLVFCRNNILRIMR